MAAKKKDLRKKIDDTLSDLLKDDRILDDIVDNSAVLPKVYVPEQHDYKEIKNSAVEKAKKTIMSLMKFYLSEDIITNEEYILAKKNIDVMTLSSLIFQLEAGEKALITLLNTINSGELSPRMFEVLATLQKSMLDIIKSQTMYLMAAEESVKKISRDLEVYKGLKRSLSTDSASNQSGNIVMGTKALMQNIQSQIKSESVDNNINNSVNDNNDNINTEFEQNLEVIETEIIDDEIINNTSNDDIDDEQINDIGDEN